MDIAEDPTEPLRRGLAVAAILASLGMVVIAERDVARRPGPAIRGPKPLWRLACTNALGAVAYLRWGRRR